MVSHTQIIKSKRYFKAVYSKSVHPKRFQGKHEGLQIVPLPKKIAIVKMVSISFN